MTTIQLDAVVKPDNQSLEIHAFVVPAPIPDDAKPMMQCILYGRLVHDTPVRPIWRDGSRERLSPGEYVLCCHAESGTGKATVSVIDANAQKYLASQEFDFSVTLDHMLPFTVEG